MGKVDGKNEGGGDMGEKRREESEKEDGVDREEKGSLDNANDEQREDVEGGERRGTTAAR